MKHVINEGGGHVWPFLDVMIPKRLLNILLNPKNIFFWPFHRRLVFISTISIILKFAVQWKIGLNSEAKVPLEFVFSWVWWRELGERGGHERKWQFETRVSPQTVVCGINNISKTFPRKQFPLCAFWGIPHHCTCTATGRDAKAFCFRKFWFCALVRAADSQMLHQQHPGTFGRERPFTVSMVMTLQFDLTSVFYRVFFDRCWTLKDWRADGSRKNILAISCFVSSTWWKVMASKNSGKWNYSFPVLGAAGANNCNYWRGNLKQVKGKLDSSTDPENSKGR